MGAAAQSLRKDTAAMERIRQGPNARFAVVNAKKVLVTSDKPLCLVWLTLEDLPEAARSAAQDSVYLGPMHSEHGPIWEVFAAAVTSDVAANMTSSVWATGRELMLSDAADADVAIAGLALGILGWHETALFDGRTGGATVSVEGGMKRQVVGGSGKLYPRTDPVAIGLILSPDGTKCLLGRSRNYPAGMYTCLSGFVDQCESVEEAF